MVIKIFTKEDAPEMRAAKELGQKFESDGFEVYYLDDEDPATPPQMELYNIYSYPAFVVATEDGQEMYVAQGEIPRESEILAYLNS